MLDVLWCGQDQVLPERPHAPVLLGVLKQVFIHPVTVVQRDVEEGLQGGSARAWARQLSRGEKRKDEKER